MKKSLATLDDQELIRRTLGGQSEAFGHLVTKYQNRLFNSMVQMLRDESEAEDVVQDAFLLAFTKLSTFKGNSAFFTWLYRVSHNVAISRIRRRKKTVSLNWPGDNERGSGQMDFPSDGAAPSDRMQRDEQAVQLMAAMDDLSPEHRAILVLREMDELDYEAIAEILEVPVGTVRSRLYRAREQLRQRLEGVADGSSAHPATNPIADG